MCATLPSAETVKEPRCEQRQDSPWETFEFTKGPPRSVVLVIKGQLMGPIQTGPAAASASSPHEKDNPAVPVTPPEQIKSIHPAYEAGSASIYEEQENSSRSSSPKLEERLEAQR